MSTNTNFQGKSIYTVAIGGDKSFYPQYVATRELIHKYSKSKHILELGGSDLQSTKALLSEGYTITNIDAATSALNSLAILKGVNTICADLEEKLPELNYDIFDVIVALDILEHLSYKKALHLLKEIRNKHKKNFVLIARMPLIAWNSIPTYLEGSYILRHFSLPPKGLFDRTHKIFKDVSGHKKLFSTAGYQILETYFSNCIDGITGNWKGLDLKRVKYINDPRQIWIASCIATLCAPFNASKRESLKRFLLRHDGLYVLRPIR